MIDKCLAWLRDHKPFEPASDDPATFQTWMLYCSINIPHPPFDTNATWYDILAEIGHIWGIFCDTLGIFEDTFGRLSMVHADKVPLPIWPSQSSFHPADSFMSISKNVWGQFSDAEIQKIRHVCEQERKLFSVSSVSSGSIKLADRQRGVQTTRCARRRTTSSAVCTT